VRREEFEAQYKPHGTSGSILITTQSTEVKDITPNRVFVEGFDDSDGAQLLLRYLDEDERARSGIIDDIEDAKKISRQVDGLPLMIATIAGYISKMKRGLPEFLSQLDENPKTFQRWGYENGPFSSEYKDSAGNRKIATVFGIALRAVKPRSRDVLDALSFMSPDDIPETMLFEQGKAILVETEDDVDLA
jgi:hypothetical protein